MAHLWRMLKKDLEMPCDSRNEIVLVSQFEVFYWCRNGESSWKGKKKNVYISESKDACDDSLEFCPEMLAFSSGGGSSVSNSVPAAFRVLSSSPFSSTPSPYVFLCRLFPFSNKMNPVIEQTITFPKSTLRLITSFFSESSGMSKRCGKQFFLQIRLYFFLDFPTPTPTPKHSKLLL